MPGRWNLLMARIMDFLNGNFSLNETKEDCILWKANKQRVLTIKLALEAIIQPQVKVNWAKLMWSSSNIPRHSFIYWLALQGKLLTKNKLLHWKVVDTNMCVLCKSDSETIEHLFFDCALSKVVWEQVYRDDHFHGEERLAGFLEKQKGKI